MASKSIGMAKAAASMASWRNINHQLIKRVAGGSVSASQ